FAAASFLVNYSVPVTYTFLISDVARSSQIYTHSLHDALPICPRRSWSTCSAPRPGPDSAMPMWNPCMSMVPAPASGGCIACSPRSEEHTSELQSRENLVCRLLLEKKK